MSLSRNSLGQQWTAGRDRCHGRKGRLGLDRSVLNGCGLLRKEDWANVTSVLRRVHAKPLRVIGSLINELGAYTSKGRLL